MARQRLQLRFLVSVAAALMLLWAEPAAADAAVSFSAAPGSPYYVGNETCTAAGHRCGNVYGVPVGDLNRDGRLDVAAAVSPWSILPLLGGPGGTLGFGAPHELLAAAGQPPRGSAVGDLNNDADPDVAATQGLGNFPFAPNGVMVARGNGAGGFANSPLAPSGGIGSEGLALGDFNGDSNQDVAVTNFATDNISILLGDGVGNLAPAAGSPVPVGDGPWAVAVRDLDGDGDRDLAVANQNSGDASILLGNGAGGFVPAPGSPVALGRGLPASIAAGDLNEDGHPDLVAAGFAAPSGLAVLLGTGDGRFNHAPGSPYSDGNAGSWAVGLGDFDRDGHQDVAHTNIGNNSISVRLGNGAGGLAAASTHSVVTGQSLPLSDCPRPAQFAVSCSPRSIAVADVSGDGADDVVAGNWNAFSVSLLLNSSNTAPVAHDDDYATDEDMPLNVDAPGVLGNDTDGENDALAAALASGPGHGTLNLESSGSFSYTPDADFAGTDSFTYRAGDGAAQSGPATVSITIRAVNDAPIARDDDYPTDEDTPLTVDAPGVLGNDSDTEGDPLGGVALVEPPAHGTLELEPDGSFSYTPEHDFAGTDSFRYDASDGGARSNAATVSITVAPVNDPPVARDDHYTTDEDTALMLFTHGEIGSLSENDTDPDDAIGGVQLLSGPAHGTLGVDPPVVVAGFLLYTPDPNFSGIDSFTYRVHDGSLFSNVATVSIRVEAVNDPPLARDDAFETDEDTPLDVPAPGVLGNDSDVDGDSVTAPALVAGAAHGDVTLDADGSFSYRPRLNFSGSDSFSYQVSDGRAASNVATVSLTVHPVNDPPLARDDFYETDEDTPLDVHAPGVLENDADVEGDPLNVVLGSGPAHGTLSLDAPGSFSYTPDPNFTGEDSFTYRATDGPALSDPATVTIHVRPVNDAPLARDDEYATDEDDALIVHAPGVLDNDSDREGDTVSAVAVAGAAHGTVSLDGEGGFVYQPTPNFAGTDSFRYKVSDGDADSNVATVSLTVRPVNDAPLAHDDTYETDEDTPLEVSAPGVLDNDADVEGDTLSAVLESGPTHGTLSLGDDGSFNYTPHENYGGEDSFTYRAGDSSAQSAPATVTITVRAVNDAPIERGDTYSTDEDRPLAVDAPGVLGNDSDPDDDPLSAVLVSGPSHGTLSPRADGSFDYSPAPNFVGIDSFTYRANDGRADSGIALVTIEVRRVSDIVFASSRSGNGDIYSLNPLTGGAPTQLTSGAAIDAEPAWSPDRTKVAFTSTRSGNVEIYRMDANGGNVRRLTTNSALDTSPAWSPDGARIAFVSNRAGNREIYVMGAATGANVTRLTTHAAADTAPAWSPDSAALAFSSARTGGGDIYLMDAATGTTLTRMTTASGMDTDPAWGRTSKIAFSTNRHGGGNFEIYTVDITGANETRLTVQSGNDLQPAWSPGGNLAFATNRDGNFEIYSMDGSGGQQRRLTTHPALDGFPDW